MIRYFAAHPTAANLLMIAFIAAGLFAYPTLQRETFPRIDAKRVEINVVYPGARPEDIEEAICQRIEDAIDGVNNVAEVACESRESLARAVVEMAEGGDLDRFANDVKTEVDAIDTFPDQAEPPIIRQLGRTDFVVAIAVTGPDNKSTLKALAEGIKDRLLRFGGVPQVEIIGFSDHQIRIELPDATLRQFSLSVSDIARAVQRQNVDLPAGNIETRDGELLVRFADQRKRISEFRNLVVASVKTGGQVYLGDIATITDRFDLDEEKIVFNGKPAAILNIQKTEREDTLDVVAAVEAFLEIERGALPPGVELVVTNDVSSIVKDRLWLLIKNGGQGLVLVFSRCGCSSAALFLLGGHGLPVSFLGAVALMILIGYSINMLTMVGLLIVIGLLMDDAIVIAENIASPARQGKAPLDAAVEGARQVMPSVFASFATTDLRLRVARLPAGRPGPDPQGRAGGHALRAGGLPGRGLLHSAASPAARLGDPADNQPGCRRRWTAGIDPGCASGWSGRWPISACAGAI